MHWGLYALLLVQTLIGWIGTAAYPAPVPFFGLFEFPQVWWDDRPLSDRLFALHFWIGILMAVLLVGLSERRSIIILCGKTRCCSGSAGRGCIIPDGYRDLASPAAKFLV